MCAAELPRALLADLLGLFCEVKEALRFCATCAALKAQPVAWPVVARREQLGRAVPVKVVALRGLFADVDDVLRFPNLREAHAHARTFLRVQQWQLPRIDRVLADLGDGAFADLISDAACSSDEYMSRNLRGTSAAASLFSGFTSIRALSLSATDYVPVASAVVLALAPQLEDLDLREVFDSGARLLRAAAACHGLVRLGLHCSKGVDWAVVSGLARLRCVDLKLVRDALRALVGLPQGLARLEVRLAQPIVVPPGTARPALPPCVRFFAWRGLLSDVGLDLAQPPPCLEEVELDCSLEPEHAQALVRVPTLRRLDVLLHGGTARDVLSILLPCPTIRELTLTGMGRGFGSMLTLQTEATAAVHALRLVGWRFAHSPVALIGAARDVRFLQCQFEADPAEVADACMAANATLRCLHLKDCNGYRNFVSRAR